VQIAATLGAFAYVLSLVSLRSLGEALARVPFLVFGAVLILIVVSLLIGATRWWLLFLAFGAPRRPSFGRLCKFYLIGFFYNTYLPGGVGGDLVRAVASRDAWGTQHAAGVAIVLVERVLGLAGLLTMCSLVLLVHPLAIVPGAAWLPAVLGLSVASAAVLLLVAAQRLVPLVPARFARLLLLLPRPQRYLPLAAAGLCSLGTQLFVALSGHLLVAALVEHASLLDSLVIIPVATAAAYLPFTVSGAGVREALFVKLYESVGVAASSALAASVLMWCSQACVAAVGGVMMLLSPLATDRESQPDSQ
jgi:glycosyltransferase 2 family protein